MSLGLAILAVVGFVFIVTRALPLSFFSDSLQRNFRVTPVGYSHLLQGQAVVSDTRGTNILEWHWCPADGLTTVCFQLTGNLGFFQGIIKTGGGLFEIKQLRFSRVNIRDLAVGNLDDNILSQGILEGIRWDWSDNCPHHGLKTSQGEVVLTGLPAGERRVYIRGDRDKGIMLTGDVEGFLDLRGNTIAGRLRVTFDNNQVSGGSSVEVDIDRRLSCRS